MKKFLLYKSGGSNHPQSVLCVRRLRRCRSVSRGVYPYLLMAQVSHGQFWGEYFFKQLQTHVTMDDLTKLSSRPMSSCDDARPPQAEVGLSVGNGEGSSTCVGDNEGTLNDHDTETSWIQCGFIKPLRVLQKLSGFTSLHYIYEVLVTLPVTSCSSERSMSRVRIVKNRLRSTMLDDWLSSLLCLASEKDILLNLELNDIVNRFANLSDSLWRQLIYN